MTHASLPEVIERFASSDCSWLTTVHPNGRPHSAPIWHVWLNGCVYVVTKETAVKVTNIRHNSEVVLTHPDPHSAIIIEGQAAVIQDKADELRPFFKEKYDWDIVTDEEYQTIIGISPTKILAWGEEGAGKRKRWMEKDLEDLRILY